MTATSQLRIYEIEEGRPAEWLDGWTRQELRFPAATAVLVATVVAAAFIYLGAGRDPAPSIGTPPAPPAPPAQPPVTKPSLPSRTQLGCGWDKSSSRHPGS